MKLKKLFSLILALVMLTAISATALAAEPVMPDANGNVSIGAGETTIGIEGRVEPLTLAATCNISTYLHIDPNQPEGSQFVSPVITVTNDCNAPITLYAVGMKATGGAPKVVAHDKFNADGWRQLTRAQTHANIALGLKAAPGSIFNILWLLLSGVELAITAAAIGLVFCITIVGFPFGLQCFKLAQLALLPFGAQVRRK